MTSSPRSEADAVPERSGAEWVALFRAFRVPKVPVFRARRSPNRAQLDPAWLALATLLNSQAPQAADASTGWRVVDDWPAVVRLAERFQLAPLLYWQLRQAGVTAPEILLARLHDAHLVAALDAMVAERTLVRVAATLTNAGLPFLVLKGLALGVSVYPATSTRPMADLDLLVHEEDADRAVQVLRALGYEVAESIGKGLFRGFVGAVPLVHPPGGLPVGLHWRLVHWGWFRTACRIPLAELWDRAVPLEAGDIHGRQLAAEDTLLHLALHMAIHHGYRDLRLFVDVDRLVRHGPALDWATCVARAEAYGLRKVLYFALLFSRELLATPVPDEVLGQLRPGRLTRWLLQRLVDPRLALDGRPDPGPQSQRLRQALLVDRLADQARGILTALFPGRAWLVARYNLCDTRSVWLYTAWHPVHMLAGTLQAAGQTTARLWCERTTAVPTVSVAEDLATEKDVCPRRVSSATLSPRSAADTVPERSGVERAARFRAFITPKRSGHSPGAERSGVGRGPNASGPAAPAAGAQDDNPC